MQQLAAHALVSTFGLFCCVVLGFSFFYDSLPLRGASDPSPGERLSTPPARRDGHRRSFFRSCFRGLLCGAGVESPGDRGRPSEARESQLFLVYVITIIFSKMSLDITTTTERHYMTRTVLTGIFHTCFGCCINLRAQILILLFVHRIHAVLS